MRTPRDSTYARVAAGGDYDADWEEHYAPPPPPNLKRAAQAAKKIATVGAAGPDRWARDDYYTADPYQSFAPLGPARVRSGTLAHLGREQPDARQRGGRGPGEI